MLNYTHARWRFGVRAGCCARFHAVGGACCWSIRAAKITRTRKAIARMEHAPQKFQQAI